MRCWTSGGERRKDFLSRRTSNLHHNATLLSLLLHPSNLMCSVMNADIALSIAMTTASSILAIVALPANLLLYSHLAFTDEDDKKTEIKWSEFSVSLGVVIAGIMLGLYLSYKLEENIEIEVEERRTSMRKSSTGSEDSELMHSFAKVVPSSDGSVGASADASVGEVENNASHYQERTASMKVAKPEKRVRAVTLAFTFLLTLLFNTRPSLLTKGFLLEPVLTGCNGR